MATSADPLIVTCGGATDAARAAARLAAGLAAAGLGTHTKRAAPGARVIAVDGCARACGSRRLESLGVAPVATVDASRCATADAAAAVVRLQLERRRAQRHRRRPPPPAPTTPAARHPHTVRDYLLVLDELSAPVVDCGAVAPGLPAVAAHVSSLLGISRPTAGEMLGRLEREGLVSRTDSRQIVLTRAGRAAADDAVRRHRLLETFAVATLGYGVPDAFARARSLDSAFDDDALARLAAALGEPERCPHGWLTDPAAARAEAAELQALSASTADATADVVCLSERPAGLLEELVAADVVPGARVRRATRDALSAAARGAVFTSPGS